MKWYLNSRTRHTEKLQDLAAYLEDQGQIVNSDWIYKGSMKPFLENKAEVQQLAKHNTDKILDSDVFVVINDLGGTDLFTKFGIALAKLAMGENINIYVVSNPTTTSLMQLHPEVVHVQSLREVLEAEGVEVIDFVDPFTETNV